VVAVTACGVGESFACRSHGLAERRVLLSGAPLGRQGPLTIRGGPLTIVGMTNDEEWRFEAWRVCAHCHETPGLEPAPPWTPGASPDPTLRPCTRCGGLKREVKTFTLVQLAAELKSVTF
jgi:hypothetical protein